MAQILRMPNPSDYKIVHQRIKKLWNDGYTRITFHARERMKERSIDITDIQNVIRYGRIIDHTQPKNLWRYVIAGQAVDGEAMKCVVEINGSLIIVTVI